MIGFSDLVDQWVIKIKCLQSFARVVLEEKMNKARNTDHVARTYEMFIYSIVKITRLNDYQTRQTHLLRNSRGAQRYVGFFLNVLFDRWLAGQTNSDHMEYMRQSWLKLFRIILYIRETGRRLGDRFHEHLVGVKNNKKSLKAVCSAL